MDLFNQLGVVLSELEDARADLFNEHLDTGLSNGVIFDLRKLPCTLKHADEVLIIRHTHG